MFNLTYPIRRITRYKSGWLVERKPPANTNTRGDREQITRLSRSSLERLAWTVSQSSTEFKSMLTLTYLFPPKDGLQSKRHLRHFLSAMQKCFGDYSYCWWLEFTRRGLPHYHLLLTLSPDAFKRTRAAVLWAIAQDARPWPYCDLKTRRQHEWKRAVVNVCSHPKSWQELRSPEGARRYALKYALKTTQKDVPEAWRNVGRFWGCDYKTIPKPLSEPTEAHEGQVRGILDETRFERWPIIPKYVIL